MNAKKWLWMSLFLLPLACTGEDDGANGTPTPTPTPTATVTPTPTPTATPSPTPVRYDFSFTGTGFNGPYGGMDHQAAIVECVSGAEPCTGTVGTNGLMAGTVPAAGDFTLLFTDVLLEGPSYELHLWVDFDENGECDSPPTDHAWVHVIGAVTTNATLNVDQDTAFNDVCGTFD